MVFDYFEILHVFVSNIVIFLSIYYQFVAETTQFINLLIFSKTEQKTKTDKSAYFIETQGIF